MVLLDLAGRAIVLGLGSYLLYNILLGVYNVTVHPLARFPGPKLAAFTRWYEIYYLAGGNFSDQIFRLHQRYGMIVRIKPGEVHILDRDFYDTLFNFDPEWSRKAIMLRNLQNSPSFAEHSMRRKAFNPFFSRTSIQRIEHLIEHRVEKLCTRLKEAGKSGSVVSLSLYYRCLTFDTIMQYALAQGPDFLEDPNQAKTFITDFIAVFRILVLIQEVPIFGLVVMILRLLPDWMPLSPKREFMTYVNTWRKDLGPMVKALAKGDFSRVDDNNHPIIFEEYFKNPALPREEKTEERVRDSVLMLVGAGLETTGYALSSGTYFLSKDPTKLRKLREEVKSIWPADGTLPKWTDLEKLPYLTGVVKESMRLSLGVMSRLHRINHLRPVQYGQWTIPPGTIVSMSQRFILYDDELFPNPKVFEPERWTQGEKSKQLDHWFVAFSRGARNCLGANLAWAEMYLTLAAVVHQFDLRLFETSDADVYPKYDFFVPFPETDNGVRVQVGARI